MKNYIITAFLALALLSGCNKSDIDDLDDRVSALEKTTTAIGVKFDNNQMVITYSDNSTESLSLADGLAGLNYVNSNDIQSISYNETTGILTITLKNGNASQFRIVGDSYSDMVATLISDVNGKMFVSEITMGALAVATFDYDEDFNMTGMLSKSFYNEQISNNFEVKKTFTDGVLTGLVYISYAQDKYVDYDAEGINAKDTIMETQVASYFAKNSDDSTYRYYQYSYYTTDGYHYSVYPHCVKRFFTSYSDFYDQEHYELFDENTVYSMYWTTYTTVPGGYDVWFIYNTKYTKIGLVNVGDVEDIDSFTLVCNVKGDPEKVYTAEDEYIQITYNSSNLPIKAEFNVLEEDEWIVDEEYMTFQYNSDNKLESLTLNFEDKSRVLFKAVYDDNGNPIEIYTWSGEVPEWYGYFDPWTDPENPWVNDEPGLILRAKIDYDYDFKNFLGNSINALFPVLQNLNLYNAPIRISSTNAMDYVSLEYSNFNNSGYPETVKGNYYGGFNFDERKDTRPSNMSVELGIKYITKE